MWQKVATEMGIPWRSAESMHWQLGEQEMSARANAPVFQLHPSATGLSSPQPAPALPAPHGFTPANAPQIIPNQLPPPPPQQYQLPPAQSGPTHSYHQRSGSNSSQGRRRNSSFSRRRTDGRSRCSVPPQLGPTLPQLQPASEIDHSSGVRTGPPPEAYSTIKKEGDSGLFVEPYAKRRREDDSTGAYRSDLDTRSPGGRSPDRCSQRSGTGSIKSVKREPSEPAQASREPTASGV